MDKDFISVLDLDKNLIKSLLTSAKVLKYKQFWKDDPKPLDGKIGALIFNKPSLRTRVSFEVGIKELGGSSIYISGNEIQIGKRESVEDVARVISRYVDFVVIRTYSQDDLETFAKVAEVPVINALTDLLHPCQIMSDIFTIMENVGQIEDIKIAYVGDGNNVANSWLNLASILYFHFSIGTVQGLEPNNEILKRAQSKSNSTVEVVYDPYEAVRDAHVIYTDVWASMGEKEKADERSNLLKKFQINQELLSAARPNAIVMHCLPAERGKEITDEVIDGPQSVVFDQAENRLHMQKAILLELLGGIRKVI
ncbi:ornithine carbamoyltransferase [bacterium]|nr:ornithine carbamoyltransferase [bacterium]